MIFLLLFLIPEGVFSYGIYNGKMVRAPCLALATLSAVSCFFIALSTIPEKNLSGRIRLKKLRLFITVDWQYPFNKDMTEDSLFYLPDGVEVAVLMMRQT